MKQIAALLLILSILLSTAGCTSLIARDYYVSEPYTDDGTETDTAASGGVKNYTALKRVISTMVENHDTEGTLTFSNYDGDVSDDLASACWEIKEDTALGAYAVDYMSYNINRIVSYYEAEIIITYRRTKTQVDSIIALSSIDGFQETLLEAMAGGVTYLAVQFNYSSLTAEDIQRYAQALYEENALSIPIPPEVSVNIYPAAGVQRIYEITLDYGYGTEQLTAMSESLAYTAATLLEDLPVGQGADSALAAALALGERCQYTGYTGLADTAYGALVEGQASSRGMALTYQALCTALELSCTLVEGSLEGETHYWNILQLGEDECYHMDLSALSAFGGQNALFLRDEDISGRYWWDTTRYPACTGSLRFRDLVPDISESAAAE